MNPVSVSSPDLFETAEDERGFSSSFVRERPRSLSSPLVLRDNDSAEKPPIIELRDMREKAPDALDGWLDVGAEGVGGGCDIELSLRLDDDRSNAFIMI